MAEKLREPQQAVVGSKTRSAGRNSTHQGHRVSVVYPPGDVVTVASGG